MVLAVILNSSQILFQAMGTTGESSR